MRKTCLLVAPLSLLVILTAWSLFYFSSGASYLDDEVNLAPLRVLEGDPSQFFYLISENQSGIFGRSVSMASFGVEVLLRDFSYEAFKKTNAVIHILNAVLVGIFSLFLFRLSNPFKKDAPLLAFCVAVFWLILPVHVSTVMYPVQRMAQLSAFFMLLGLVAYGYGRVLVASDQYLKGGALLCGALLVIFPLGLLSKENAILMLPLMGLLEVFISKSLCSGWDRRFLAGWCSALFVAVLLVTGFSEKIIQYINADYRIVSPYLAFLTQTRIVFSYIWEIISPSNSRFGYFHDDILASVNMLDPLSTVLSVVGVVVLLVLSAVWLLKSKSLVALGILFFFVGHALESTILPLEFYFEHRNYLPSVGIVIGLVSAGYWLGKKLQIMPFLGLLLVGFLSVNTFILIERNQIWNNPEVGIAISEMNHPKSPRSIAALAMYQAESSFYEASLRNLARVQMLKPDLYSAVEFQKVYAKCINGYTITLEDFSHFSGEFLLGSPRYFNKGVAELAKAISETRCSSIRREALLELSDYFFSPSSVHPSTHKVIAELMLANDAITLATRHLLRADEGGGLDIRSRLLLFELLIAEGDFRSASKMEDDLEQGLSEAGVDNWLVVFEQARKFLNSEKEIR